MKRGDLVKRKYGGGKEEEWIGIVIEVVKTTYQDGSAYEYPNLIWIDDGQHNDFQPDSCSPTLLEVISECK